IWHNGYLRNSASRSPSRHSAGSSGPWATANSRPGRATTLRRRARSRILKKLPHPSGDGRAREGHRLRHNRNLVRRRGPHRPEEQNHSPPAGASGATRPRAPRDQRTASPYILGAVGPKGGKGAALTRPACNSEAMTLHLAEIAKAVAPAAHAILLVDQAGWHLSTRL